MKFIGIVLRTYPLRENDLIVRVFSPELGKVSLQARSARRSKRRFPGGIETFDIGAFETHPSRSSLETLQRFEPTTTLSNLRSDFSRLSCASILVEILDALCPEDHREHHESNSMFLCLLTSLEFFDSTADTRELLRRTYLAIDELLALSGFRAREETQRPSANSLLSLLNTAEHILERPLASRPAMEMVVKSLRDRLQEKD